MSRLPEMFKRFLSRWQRRRAIRKAAQETERHLTVLENMVEQSLDTIGIVSNELETLRSTVRDLQEDQRRYRQENEALRSELTVIKEVTVPGLVSANNLILQRVEADIAVQVKRQVTGA